MRPTVLALHFLAILLPPLLSNAQPLLCENIFQHTLHKKSFLTKEISSPLSQSAEASLASISRYVKRPASPNDSLEQRYDLLKNLPIGNLIVAPGHNILRNREQIESLKKFIKENDQGHFENDKILLNIITEASGKVISVDIWNAHHRLLAYQELGFKTIGELKIKNLEILINGMTTNKDKWNHFIPAAGIDYTQFRQLRKVQPGFGIQPNTLEAPGEFSNYTLGSRTTLKDLATAVSHKPKVGIYFGTFDPLHEGHIQTAKKAMKELNLDEVILFPNALPLHKPNATPAHHRIEMAKIRIKEEKGLNLYEADSGLIIQQFGKELLIEQVQQAYVTKDVYEILGDDAYATLLQLNQISANSNRKYVVMARSQDQSIHIPEHLKEIVIKSQSTDSSQLSSTLIRKKIQTGEPISRHELFPEIKKYIQDHRLYDSGAAKQKEAS